MATRTEQGGTAESDFPPESGASVRPHRGRLRLANALIVLGIVVMVYAAVVVLWSDPATGLYARWKQHQLAGQIDDVFSTYATGHAALPQDGSAQRVADEERRGVAAAAREMARTVEDGDPLGKITVPKIGIHPVFLQGTSWAQDLSRGPGHYPETALPGLGRTSAIAGHRTTFGAWFRHIDSLRAGDSIIVRLPYATFYYRVFGHRIVASNDWSIIRNRGFDGLVLSACHPLYSASHRWIVFAALYRVDPVKGPPYAVDMRNDVRPLGA
jgi:sortase A